MQHRVVGGPAWRRAEEQPARTAHREPRVSAQQGERNEAWRAFDPHGSARDVVACQPRRQGHQSDAAHPHPDVCRCDAHRDPDAEGCGTGHEADAGAVGELSEAGQLEPLAGDGQDEERRQPWNDLRCGASAQQEDGGTEPGQRTDRLHRRMERALDAIERDVHRHEDGGTTGEQRQRQESRCVSDECQPARAGQQRRQIAPAAAQRDGTLERDERPQEAQRHERAVVCTQASRGCRHRHTQEHQRTGQSGEQADAAQRHEPIARGGQTGHPSCALAVSVMRSTDQRGSYVTSTCTSSTVSTSKRTRRISPVM